MHGMSLLRSLPIQKWTGHSMLPMQKGLVNGDRLVFCHYGNCLALCRLGQNLLQTWMTYISRALPHRPCHRVVYDILHIGAFCTLL